jgi:hypothetical protein
MMCIGEGERKVVHKGVAPQEMEISTSGFDHELEINFSSVVI